MKDKEDSGRKWQWGYVINRKNLGERDISFRSLGGLRVRKS